MPVRLIEKLWLRIPARNVYRGAEWRAGLTGVVQAMERNPEIAPLIETTFPELRLTESVVG